VFCWPRALLALLAPVLGGEGAAAAPGPLTPGPSPPSTGARGENRTRAPTREAPTMTATATILREIHRLRRQAAELQARIDQGPRQLKAQHARIARQEETLRQAQDAVKHLKVTMHEKDVSLKATQQQIAKYEKQLNEVTSKKEFDA